MTVQTNDGPIVMGSKDKVFTTHGVTWGIKCRNSFGTQYVMVVEKDEEGVWNPVHDLDSGFDSRIDDYPNVLDYFIKVIIPSLKVWLASRFKVGGSQNQMLSKFQQLDVLIQGITVQSMDDGTVVVV